MSSRECATKEDQLFTFLGTCAKLLRPQQCQSGSDLNATDLFPYPEAGSFVP
jgi:hypothetical protein